MARCSAGFRHRSVICARTAWAWRSSGPPAREQPGVRHRLPRRARRRRRCGAAEPSVPDSSSSTPCLTTALRRYWWLAPNRGSLCEAVVTACARPARCDTPSPGPTIHGPDEGAEWPETPIDAHAPVMLQFSSGSTGRPKQIARTHAQPHVRARRADSGLGAQLHGSRSWRRALFAREWTDTQSCCPACGWARRSIRWPAMSGRPRPISSTARACQFSSRSRSCSARWRKPVFAGRPISRPCALCVSASAPDASEVQSPLPREVRHVRPPALRLDGDRHDQREPRRPTSSTRSNRWERRSTESWSTCSTMIAGAWRLARPESSPCRVRERSRGYAAAAASDQEAFHDGYFFTGDLGRKDADGRLYLVGRKKFVINKGGSRSIRGKWRKCSRAIRWSRKPRGGRALTVRRRSSERP